MMWVAKPSVVHPVAWWRNGIFLLSLHLALPPRRLAEPSQSTSSRTDKVDGTRGHRRTDGRMRRHERVDNPTCRRAALYSFLLAFLLSQVGVPPLSCVPLFFVPLFFPSLPLWTLESSTRSRLLSPIARLLLRDLLAPPPSLPPESPSGPFSLSQCSAPVCFHRLTMATIEPRLIHLLNESAATPRPHRAELPPIKVLPLPQTPGRFLPIDPGTSQRSDVPDVAPTSGQLVSQPVPSLYSAVDEVSTPNSALRNDAGYPSDRTLLSHISSQDLRMILDDTPDNAEDSGTKKRRPVKEDFVQLPQPLKKQKAATQQHMFPPIIVGLLEPPFEAALFPPISSASFDDRPHSEPPQSLSIAKPTEISEAVDDKPNPSPPLDSERTPTGKIKRRAAKPRRKWSEDETNHLLLGVSRHGVGRWTDILEDPEYTFNDRTAGDLKDRFRTCCPEELRASSTAKNDIFGAKRPTVRTRGKPKKGLMSENILNETEEEAEAEQTQSGQNESDPTPAPRQRKSRAHRKKLEDLAELGIKGPFKKSHRRERRPFSEQDDREILEGFELYGPQWTKIQRDPRFNLSSRQPTDLRDRLRNKYPEKFSGTEKTTMQVREPGRGNSLLEPSVNMAIENSLHVSKSALLEPQLNRTNSKEDIPRWPLSSNHSAELGEASQPPHANFYWSEGPGTGFAATGMGEMDISRLLLDDTQVATDAPSDKRGLG
ncbi:hypothetical protein GGS23DRAFT_176996 [Durotheca rogersii]|uniref:uncharacterized protein n=1 Tax=Durotheca rogersii TaxID=419775 RepID=UPI0022210B13|nr:uncharacterized protein GGS23DRAFT_176996 [Durotheca rogersii]KAI5867418.1 hypothetical protein GGS23DRAFT_176996 [Durotheca rogersii]